MPPVVIIGSAHPLRGGGLATFNERLARQFQSAGREVVIYTFSLQYPSFLFPGRTQYSEEPAPEGLNIRVRINSVNPWNWWRVGLEIRRLSPALVVVRYWLPFMGPCLGTILRVLRQGGGARVVCIADNIIPHERRPGDRLFTRYFLGSVDAFVTLSRSVLDDLRRFGVQRPAVCVPHPLYDNFGAPMARSEARALLGLPPEGVLLLFFGFIRPYKGLDLLLEAMGDDRVRASGVRLVVAGEYYTDPAPYAAQIHRLGLADRVILRTDFIPDGQVRAYLGAADLVVQPYRSATQSGVTPLAYHFERPMLVTRVGALPEMVPDGRVGLVCEPTAAALAEGILRFLALGAAHFEPGIRAEKRQYTWQRLQETLETLADGG
jgi:glycosyltransferase involved in cell wall biosynthesis